MLLSDRVPKYSLETLSSLVRDIFSHPNSNERDDHMTPQVTTGDTETKEVTNKTPAKKFSEPVRIIICGFRDFAAPVRWRKHPEVAKYDDMVKDLKEEISLAKDDLDKAEDDKKKQEIQAEIDAYEIQKSYYHKVLQSISNELAYKKFQEIMATVEKHICSVSGIILSDCNMTDQDVSTLGYKWGTAHGVQTITIPQHYLDGTDKVRKCVDKMRVMNPKACIVLPKNKKGSHAISDMIRSTNKKVVDSDRIKVFTFDA